MRILASASRFAFTSLCYIFLFFIILVTGAHATDFDISSKVQVIQSRLMFDRSSNTSYLNVTVKNTSDANIPLPIHLVVDSITSTEVTVKNSDNKGLPGKPFIILTTENAGHLKPGESTVSKMLSFQNTKRLTFNFTIKVYVPVASLGVIGPEGGSISVNNPQSDANGVGINLPSGAVAQKTTFSIGTSEARDVLMPMMPPHQKAMTPLIDVRSSSSLNQPAELCFPLVNTNAAAYCKIR
jgi:hypothetical protein